MSEELDAKIAAFTGWEHMGPGGWWMERGTGQVRPEAPPYSGSLDWCALAEARVVELGRGEAYREALDRAWALGNQPIRRELWLITAPAEARCRAMLNALEAQP